MTDGGKSLGPCSGIKVLEIATMVAGPMAGQMLADLGAEVIKIEPPGGDTLRVVHPLHKGIGALFMTMNRHKRSIVLDLKSAKGQTIARKLALSSDVLIENSRPGVLEKLGLGYEALREQNPGLIYTSVSGFGQSGPYVRRPAYEQVLQAMTGSMTLQNPLGDPQPIRNAIADKYTASSAASAITAALLYRERHGGVGQRVEVSLLDAFSSFALQGNIHNYVYVDSDARIPYINSYVPIRTADGFVMGWIQTDDHFARLCRFAGREELIEDPRFATGWNRISNIEEMWREIEKTISTMSTDEVVAGAEREGFALGKVNTVAEFFEDPQVRHNRSVVEYRDEEFGTIRHLNYPARFEKSPANVEARSPKLGEHSDAVLAELGMDAKEIAEFREAGVVA